MSSFIYSLSRTYNMYVCKGKLTAGRERRGKNGKKWRKTKGNPSTFEKGKRREEGERFSVSKRTPWKLPSITARRSGHLVPSLRTKDHANPPWIGSISRRRRRRRQHLSRGMDRGPISSGHFAIFHSGGALAPCNPILRLTTGTCRLRRENIDDFRDATRREATRWDDRACAYSMENDIESRQKHRRNWYRSYRLSCAYNRL